MKKITMLFILTLAIILTMILPVQAAQLDLVVDEVGILTEDERLDLNQIANDITEQYQCEVSIVIVDNKGSGSATEFAKSIYNEKGHGYGADKDGLMLLLSMSDRDYALIAFGYGNTAFTDHGKAVLLDRHLLPLLGEDKYYDGFLTFLNQTDEYLNMARNNTPFDVDTDDENGLSPIVKLAIIILLPLLIAGIICFIFLQNMKTAVLQSSAHGYMPDGGVNLTMKADNFLFKTETRRKIEKESSSGGTTTDKDGFSGREGKF